MKEREWEGVEEPWTPEEREEQLAAGEGGKTPAPHYPPIVEFGPGGSGCPHTKATPPEARAGGEPLTETGSVPVGAPVTLTSELKAGDALKEGEGPTVEWVFTKVGEEAVKETQLATTDRWTRTKATHIFEHEGAFKVKEIVHTNNLATPAVTVEAGTLVHVSEAIVTKP